MWGQDGDMALWLVDLAHLADDLSLIPSTNMVAHTCQELPFQGTLDSSGLCGHQVCGTQTGK